MALVGKNRVAILVVGIVTLLMYGIIYAWSIFIPPLEQEFGWSRSSTSLVFSVAMVGLSLGMLSVGQLAKRFSLRRCFEFAMVLVPAGLVACQFITQLWQLYVVYGVVCGIGCGIAYTTWTKHVISWFGDIVGLASGLLVMGFGMGALVLGGIAARLIYSPVGWRWTFSILGMLVFLWSLVALSFIRRPPTEIAFLHPEHDDTGLELRGSETVREPSFWLFCMWRSTFMGSVAAIIAQASVIMIGIGAPLEYSSAVVGLLGLGNGIGRPFGGIIFDKAGQSRALVAFSTCGLIVSVLLVPLYLMRAYFLVGILILCIGVVYGMYASMNNSYMRTTFGIDYLAANTGISAVVLAPFNLLFPFVAAMIYELSGGYDAYFYLVPILALVSLLCGTFCKPAIARMKTRRDGTAEHVA